MHLMYYLDDEGKRVYTLKVSWSECLACSLARVRTMLVCSFPQKVDPSGKPTISAHPGKPSRDDLDTALQCSVLIPT